MSEIQYISLYDYLGRSTAKNKDGVEVAKIADEKGIKPKYQMLPEEVQLICANMCFNLGINRFGRFEKFLAAVENRNWSTAAYEMEDSKWHKQVPKRSNRLIIRMQKEAEK